MPSEYQKFVKAQMSGKKFKSRLEANVAMKQVGHAWSQVKIGVAPMAKRAKKVKGRSVFGDLAGGAFGVAGDLSRKYM